MVAKLDIVREHMSAPSGMLFYNSLESACNDINILGYWSVIRRAWNELKLDGVLCIDGRPVLYLKKHGRPFSLNERIRLQKLFWNQGISNILVLADPTTVYIYSGLGTPPQDDSDIDETKKGLVEELTLVDYVHRIQSLYHDLATGHYYETHHLRFDPEQSVDSWLLDNLRALRHALTEGDNGLDIKDAHSLIGRVLFLCYLLDREIFSVGKLSPGHTGAMLLASKLESLSFSERIDYLYGEIFNDLKVRFNGNMFDQDLDTEAKVIRPFHLHKLVDFLGGLQVKTGQRTLGFWPYDFKMIPVETISAIYQDFLGAEDQQRQRKRGAFYTPRFLVEMVIDVAINAEQKAYDWSYLDPACGSGIFLVTLFNRLANYWIYSQTGRVNYVSKAKALKSIFDRQIRGVDVEETACRIACFSLYLAYLDFFDPPDIRDYIEKTGQPLPRLLDYGDEPDRPTADIPVIHKADFLTGDIFRNETFDCIVGNPPWEGRQRKQLAQKFLEIVPHFLKDNGIGCLLLPTKILQNQTNAFQGEWLQKVTLEKVIQLADYRFLLFQDALCPAIIAKFKNIPPLIGKHHVEFNAPKFNRNGLRKGVIIINPSASDWISLRDLLEASKNKNAPVVWKKHLWGTRRDQKLLELLQSLPPLSDLAGTPSEGKRWNKGKGFQPYYPEKAKSLENYPKPKPNPWNLDTPYLQADQQLQMIVFEQDTIKFGERLEKIKASKKDLRRVPRAELFKAPMVLASKGFTKVFYCDFDVLFEDALQSFTGQNKDADLLKFLAAYLRSSLARYFLFHTSANWGSERDQVHLNELLRVPFPLPGNDFISSDAKQIVKHIANKMDQLHSALEDKRKMLMVDAKRHTIFPLRNEDVNKEWLKVREKNIDLLQREFEPFIYQYFGLTQQEINLIEDTIHINIPSSTPTTWRTPKTVSLDSVQDTKVEPYSGQGLKVYADNLTSTLNQWAQVEGSKYRVLAEGGIDVKTGIAMVSVYLSDASSSFREIALSKKLADTLLGLHKQVARERGALIYERDILHFSGNRIYIVRPNTLLNWTRTAALNDAARIYGEIALAKEES